jgi:ABC-type branched-subunit amino acid transport system permease subunit
MKTLMHWLKRFDGTQTLGRGRTFWASFAVTVVVLATVPFYAEFFIVNNLAYFLLWTFMALGLSLIWGHAGILSFGQTAFFGLAGYSYGVISINLGDAHGLTWVAFAVALILPTLLAALIGYFMFYGGVRDVFVGIVTLSITLVMETFMAQTAGPEWAIGDARLNGFNGMSNMPPLTVPWFGDQAIVLEGTPFYWFVLALVVAVYIALRWLVNSRFGNVLVAIRENPDRAEMLGYNVQLYQLAVFAIGGTLAGISGVLYTTWGSYITPSAMGLTAAALPIVWTAAGGRKDITTTLVATVFLIWMSQMLAVKGSQYALVLMGAILLGVVLLAPDGLVLLALRALGRMTGRGSRSDPSAEADPASR